MDLVIRQLDFEKCIHFISKEFDNELLLSELILSNLRLEEGIFYTIIPDNVREEALYEFKTGGKIYPFHRPKDVTVMPVRNDSENIFSLSLINYISQSDSHFLGIEDYSAEPNYTYIKEYKLQYHVLSNGHLFYLLNSDLSSKEIMKYYGLSKGYLFLCAILKLDPSSIDFISTHNELSNENVLENIFVGINSFFVEIYDGSGYLLWASKKDDSFLRVIENKLIDNNNSWKKYKD